MSRYDGLIIPRSYSEYINKTDAATLQQALQLSGVLSGAVAAGDNKAVKSSAVYEAVKKTNKIYEYKTPSNVYIYLFAGGDTWDANSIDYIKVLEKRFNFAPSLIEFSYTKFRSSPFRYNFNEILHRDNTYGNKIIITNNYKVYLKVVGYSCGRIETNRVLQMEKYTALPTGETEKIIL